MSQSSDNDTVSLEVCMKKIEELETSLEEERKKSQTYLNQLKYARADLDNLQKNIQKRIEEGIERGLERFIIQLFPVAEELDLALEAAKKDENDEIAKGIEMVRKKFWKVLELEGLTQIESIGKLFDPNLHEVVMEAELPDHPNGIILEEFRKGFKYKGKVLRPSMVKVVKNIAKKEAD
ncbi:nucleotide exchange factor GrpE [Candidatus Bathyarchaeota archaeon]|nr:nucleotide exchange factor GrpE [Candidatus Bathyarchaeota archaeon]MBS7630949.1 nucleotide exchange factor GrpE [Candidatus Bathyarchaeota archaeon]